MGAGGRTGSRQIAPAHGDDRFEVALQLRFRTAGPDDDPAARARAVEQAVGRRQPVAALGGSPSARSSASTTSEPPRAEEAATAAAPSPARSATGPDAHGQLVGGVQRRGSARGRRARRAASGPAPSPRRRARRRAAPRVIAVLVAHPLGVHAVAERLLVAEDETVDPGDPLEPGQRHLVARSAASGGDPGQQRRRHDRVREDGAVGAAAARAGAAPSSAPTSSPRSIRQPPSAAGSGRPRRTGRRPGRWRSPGRHRARAAAASARSMAPGSSGLGNATSGSRGRGRPAAGPRTGRRSRPG